jgi:hypothetical protein
MTVVRFRCCITRGVGDFLYTADVYGAQPQLPITHDSFDVWVIAVNGLP